MNVFKRSQKQFEETLRNVFFSSLFAGCFDIFNQIMIRNVIFEWPDWFYPPPLSPRKMALAEDHNRDCIQDGITLHVIWLIQSSYNSVIMNKQN